jgi:hypothetical protein
MPNPPNPQDPKRPSPRDPRDVNPRDPQGGVGSELNPTRDHVQGEPEGTTPDANEHAPTSDKATPPPKKPDPYDLKP